MTKTKKPMDVVTFVALMLTGLLAIVVMSNRDYQNSARQCQRLGTDPDDMIYVHNGHYLCVTADGRVVGRT